jgi:hypothetical protein
MHVYYRTVHSWSAETQSCGDTYRVLKTQSTADVVPADDTERRRTICSAQACPLLDHMLHELHKQFLNEVPIHYYQGVLNPQLPSTYQRMNQFVLRITPHYHCNL